MLSHCKSVIKDIYISKCICISLIANNLPYKLTEYIGMNKIVWGIGEIDGALYSEMKRWNSLFSDGNF